MSLSCITFGAPPIFTVDVNPLLQLFLSLVGNSGVVLSIINDGDPIPRMDTPYTAKLIRLIQEANANELGIPIDGEELVIANDRRVSSRLRSDGSRDLPALRLPALSLHRIGEIVLQKDANDNVEGDMDLRLLRLEERDLTNLLFANFFAHLMDIYMAQASQLAQGVVNGRPGWQIQRSTFEEADFF